MNLPPSVTNGKNHAVILPIFFYLRDMLLDYCHDLKTCLLMYVISIHILLTLFQLEQRGVCIFYL